MPSLYETFLPIVQDLNTYGGNFTAHHISRAVLDEIDAGAPNDPSLEVMRRKLLSAIGEFRGLQDHARFSAFFEAYYEAVVLLLAGRRGVPLRPVPAGPGRGNTPDFLTLARPEIGFEVKTIDVADPTRTYDKTMEEGLEAKLEAEALARERGIGSSVRTIAAHGDAKDRRDVVEQVMRKIDGNVKAGQYAQAPTFLVVSTVRTAIQDRAENLRRRLPWPDQATPVSGQLFAIAAHKLGEEFYFFPEWGHAIVSLGPINRQGILRDHPFIAGLIFLSTEWSKTNGANALDEAYHLNGVWNSDWERTSPFAAEAMATAKAIFERLCHDWNDTEDTRASRLPLE